MKIIASLLLFACLQCCFGQTDTHVIATGDWSETVSDGRLDAIRGRLLVYDDTGLSAGNHARIYLELQHVFKGEWFSSDESPLEFYYETDRGNSLSFEMSDGHGQPIPSAPIIIAAPSAIPFCVTLPCDAT